jgi:predicted metal-dependent peptidase
VNWNSILKQGIENAMQDVPVETRGDIVVMIDTSDSMTDDVVRSFIEEVAAIRHIETLFVTRIRMTRQRKGAFKRRALRK